MARAVRSGQILKGIHHFLPMPQLEDGYAPYEQYMEERLKEFPPNAKEIMELEEDKDLNPFCHELRYDAESAFWLLLWWAMQAKPKDDTSDEDKIKNRNWDNLTDADDEDDSRATFILQFPKTLCHAGYRELDGLLEAMARQLKGDHGSTPSRRHPEYLHEAFQRLIFEFLSKHGKAKSKFLTLEKSETLRKLREQVPMKQPLPTSKRTWGTSQVTASHVASSQKRKHGDGDDGDYIEASQSNKKVSRTDNVKYHRYSPKLDQEVISSRAFSYILAIASEPLCRSRIAEYYAYL
jgi:hypothetical protein